MAGQRPRGSRRAGPADSSSSASSLGSRGSDGCDDSAGSEQQRTLYCLACVEDGRRGATLMRPATEADAAELSRLLSEASDVDSRSLLSFPPFSVSSSGAAGRTRSGSSVEQALPGSPASTEGPPPGISAKAAQVLARAEAEGVNPVKFGGPCHHCGVADSPQWRRGPPEKPILCNACGTRYRRTNVLAEYLPAAAPAANKKRPAAGAPPAAAAAKAAKAAA